LQPQRAATSCPCGARRQAGRTARFRNFATGTESARSFLRIDMPNCGTNHCKNFLDEWQSVLCNALALKLMRPTIVALVGALTLCSTTQASLYLLNTNAVGSLIPDNGSTLSVQQAVSGLPSVIQDVDVKVTISGGYNGDLYGYLRLEPTGGGAAIAVLLNRVGNGLYADTGFAVILSDQAGTDIHAYQTVGYPGSLNGSGQLTGTWQPDGRNANPGAGQTGDTRGALLGQFNGMNPNGTWTLSFADFVGGGSQSTLVSWSLDVTAVPEPVTTALGIFGVLAAGFGLGRRFYARSRQ
jgi:subtilisin-like proprotein convertase family protein